MCHRERRKPPGHEREDDHEGTRKHHLLRHHRIRPRCGRRPPLAWGSTGSVASEAAVLFAHSDAVSATTDGSWGYFVGHNPGDFANVMDLTEGDAVTVCDRDSAFRTYYMVDTFTVTTETYWGDIKDRVTDYGESIGLQCCVGDGAHYRVVVAC